VLRGDPGERDAGVDSELLEGVAEVPADGVGGDAVVTAAYPSRSSPALRVSCGPISNWASWP
jgi:hypothetical protein